MSKCAMEAEPRVLWGLPDDIISCATDLHGGTTGVLPITTSTHYRLGGWNHQRLRIMREKADA
jgi:hypothetical protein